jgi:hypothetical protein
MKITNLIIGEVILQPIIKKMEKFHNVTSANKKIYTCIKSSTDVNLAIMISADLACLRDVLLL